MPDIECTWPWQPAHYFCFEGNPEILLSLSVSSVHITARRYCFAIGILTLGFQWFIKDDIQNFPQTHNAAMVLH
jgi:hypothetical protein